MEVGIRELRSNLAAILDEVDKGVTVTVTHRGTPRAVLAPLVPRKETSIERGIREGWIRVGPTFGTRTGPRPPAYVARSRPGAPSLAEIIAEDREERLDTLFPPKQDSR